MVGSRITRDVFGTLPDGRDVERIVLRGEGGFEARIITHGAVIQALIAPDAKGGTDDVVLGHDAFAGYLAERKFFGATVGRYANRLHLPMAIIDKRRYDDSEKPKPAHLIGQVKGMHAIIVDDEVSTGRTLIEAAAYLTEQGAVSVTAAFTHPVLAGEATKRLEDSCIGQLVCTDTIPLGIKKSPKLHVLGTAELFAKAIRRIHDGESISELFR